MSCDFLKLRSNDTDFAALLGFVTELPGAVRPALVRPILQHNSQSLKEKSTVCNFGDINKFRLVCCVTSENASLMN